MGWEVKVDARRKDKEEREGKRETERGFARVGVKGFNERAVDGEWSGKEWKKEDRLISALSQNQRIKSRTCIYCGIAAGTAIKARFSNEVPLST